MNKVSEDHWDLDFPDCNVPLEVKALLEDSQWMNGANAFIKEDTQIYPWFGYNKGTFKIFKDVYSP